MNIQSFLAVDKIENVNYKFRIFNSNFVELLVFTAVVDITVKSRWNGLTDSFKYTAFEPKLNIWFSYKFYILLCMSNACSWSLLTQKVNIWIEYLPGHSMLSHQRKVLFMSRSCGTHQRLISFCYKNII